jgi:hypothetical protein
MKKILFIALLLSVLFNIYQWRKYSEVKVVGFSDSGLPCLYSSTEKTLDDGQGTSFRCDQNGNLIFKN